MAWPPVASSMATGVVLNPRPTATNAVDDVVEQASRAFEIGVRRIWLPQRFDYDAISLAGHVGAAVPGLGSARSSSRSTRATP